MKPLAFVQWYAPDGRIAHSTVCYNVKEILDAVAERHPSHPVHVRPPARFPIDHLETVLRTSPTLR